MILRSGARTSAALGAALFLCSPAAEAAARTPAVLSAPAFAHAVPPHARARANWISPEARRLAATGGLLFAFAPNEQKILLYPKAKPGKPVGYIVDGLDAPVDLATDPTGRLFVANQPTLGQRYPGDVLAFAPPFTGSPYLVDNVPAQDTLTTEAVGPDDTVYASAFDPTPSFNILAYTPQGAGPATVYQTTSSDIPTALTVDASGDLFIAYQVTMQGQPVGQVFEFPPGAHTPINTGIGLRSAPNNLAFDASGNLVLSTFVSNTQSAIDVYPPGATQPSATIQPDPGFVCGMRLDTSRGVLYATIGNPSGGVYEVQALAYPSGTTLFRNTHVTTCRIAVQASAAR